MVGTNDDQETTDNPCVGTITNPPIGVTLITVQGARFEDGESLKTTRLLVSVGPHGDIIGLHNSSEPGR